MEKDGFGDGSIFPQRLFRNSMLHTPISSISNTSALYLRFSGSGLAFHSVTSGHGRLRSILHCFSMGWTFGRVLSPLSLHGNGQYCTRALEVTNRAYSTHESMTYIDLYPFTYSYLNFTRTSKVTTLNTLEEKAKLYQKIRLLSKMYAESSEAFVLPALQLTLGLIVIFSVSAVIQLFSKMDPIVISILIVFSIVTSGIQFYIYTKASKIHATSTEVEEYFYLLAQTRVDKITCEACPPIGVSLSHFFVLKKGTPLTALGIILNCIINVLLA